MTDIEQQMTAFDAAMAAAGYDKPESSWRRPDVLGGYLWQRDQDRFVGFQLALASQPQLPATAVPVDDLDILARDWYAAAKQLRKDSYTRDLPESGVYEMRADALKELLAAAPAPGVAWWLISPALLHVLRHALAPATAASAAPIAITS